MQVARAFFQAATKLSDDNEDILPQVSTRVCPFSPFASPRTFLVLGTLGRRATTACASVAQALLHAAAVCPVVSWHRDA